MNSMSSSVLGSAVSRNSSFSADDTLRKSCGRVERIDQVLCGFRQLTMGTVCQPCLSEIAWKAKKATNFAQQCRDRYQQLVRENKSSKVGANITQGMKEKMNDKQWLTGAVTSLEREFRDLCSEEAFIDLGLASASERHTKLLIEQGQLEGQIHEKDVFKETAESEINNLLRLIDASAREINLWRYTSSARCPLFDLRPLFDPVRVEQRHYGVVNGHRLAYSPLAQCNLNWGEVNYSWSNVLKLLRCVRHFHSMPQCVDFSWLDYDAVRLACLGEHNSRDDAPVGRYVVRLQPLRDRALLLVEYEGEHYPPVGKGNRVSDQYGNSSITRSASVHQSSSLQQSQQPALKTAAAESSRAPLTQGRWTLHLEGGIHTTTAISAQAEALSEYDEAVLVMCGACVVTLMEVLLRKADDQPALSPSIAGAGAKQSTKGSAAGSGQGRWSLLEDNFAGSMQDLALALVVLRGDLHLVRHVGDSLGVRGAAPAAGTDTATVGSPLAASPNPQRSMHGKDASPKSTNWEERYAAIVERVCHGCDGPPTMPSMLLACLAASAGTEGLPVGLLMQELVHDLLLTLSKHCAT